MCNERVWRGTACWSRQEVMLGWGWLKERPVLFLILEWLQVDLIITAQRMLLPKVC